MQHQELRVPEVPGGYVAQTPPQLPKVADDGDYAKLPLFSLNDTFETTVPKSAAQDVGDFSEDVIRDLPLASFSPVARDLVGVSPTGTTGAVQVVCSAVPPIPFNASKKPDLNCAPPNWLLRDSVHGVHLNLPWSPFHSSCGLLELLSQVQARQRDAQDDDECAAMVPDVLCPADDLKQLILASFTSNPLALAVHRIGPTLLLEGGFNAPCPAVVDSRRKALYSKLLYYSILSDSDTQNIPPPPMAEPNVFFRRSLHWKFNDLSVLLGTNTPILKTQDTREEVTLQLHDVDDYFSRSEALSFWLDNVMSNVEKVAICFHKDGVVQGYQIVSTQNIPSLCREGFEPIAIQQHTSNVIRWLKLKCKDTGSYVLVKDPQSNELKLFDISDIIEQGAEASQPPPSVKSPAALHQLCQSSTNNLCDLNEHNSSIPDELPPRACMSPLRRVPPQTVPTSLRALSYPVAMMCFRMSQCLPNSDAESLRLLLKCISLLSGSTDMASLICLASSHVQCMQYYHSSSPLPEADSLATSHARKAIEVLRSYFTQAQLPATERTGNKDAPLSSSDCDARHISTAILKCLCSLSLQHVRANRCVDAVEAIVLAQQVVLLRKADVPMALLLAEVPGPTTSEQASCSPSPEPTSAHNNELVAALGAMEAVVGDILHHFLIAAHLSPTQQDREKGKSTISAAANAASLFLADFPPDDLFGSLPDALDVLSLLNPPTSDALALFDKGVTAYHRAISHGTLLHSECRDLRRKLAGLHSEIGVILSQSLPAGVGASRQLLQAVDFYRSAKGAFGEQKDSTNVILMSVNIAKTLVRIAELVRVGPNALSHEEEGFLLESSSELHKTREEWYERCPDASVWAVLDNLYGNVNLHTGHRMLCCLSTFGAQALEAGGDPSDALRVYETKAIECLQTAARVFKALKNAELEARSLRVQSDLHYELCGVVPNGGIGKKGAMQQATQPKLGSSRLVCDRLQSAKWAITKYRLVLCYLLAVRSVACGTVAARLCDLYDMIRQCDLNADEFSLAEKSLTVIMDIEPWLADQLQDTTGATQTVGESSGSERDGAFESLAQHLTTLLLFFMKHLQQADKQGVTLRDLLFAKKEAQNEALLKTCLQSLLNAALQPASEKGYTLLSILRKLQTVLTKRRATSA